MIESGRKEREMQKQPTGSPPFDHLILFLSQVLRPSLVRSALRLGSSLSMSVPRSRASFHLRW